MLEKIKKGFTPEELLSGNYGIERETLRVNDEGSISKKKHPKIFGDKIENMYITTDFAESQIEMVTPALGSPKKVYDFTNALYDITAMEIKDELLWPQSMPSIVPPEEDIALAEYRDDEEGKKAFSYREKLIKKYGGKKQLICGIHYNFSFTEDFIQKLYCNIGSGSYKEFKNKIYLKISRNYLRYRWLITYLLGCSNIVDKSYECACASEKYEISKNSYTNDGALSYRNSECGYKNKVDLFPSYNSVEEYEKSIKSFIKDGIIDSHKELYASIRLKSKNPHDFMQSLLDEGIYYLEYRNIDVNPFEKCGISLEDLEFLQIFNLYLLLKEENNYDKWQSEAAINHDSIAKFGLKDLTLIRDGEEIKRKKWSYDILNEMLQMCKILKINKEELINKAIEKVSDEKMTYAYKIKKLVEEEGYIKAHINLAQSYKKLAYENRFKLCGFEKLELSTQILMKEAIKRGIKTEVIDETENFISLKKGNHIEYVKQATKTSKDNYVSVLIMENKSVTKTVLKNSNIRVPQGIELYSKDESFYKIEKYVNKPVVIKPKSTNFGTGISIFKDGADRDTLLKAIDIAFKYDNTVLLEEFISGKEYRFLVIDDKVCGILHRVPANVCGDGEKSIRELVKIKNEDPLRGYHYVTPLEKIVLDENAELFLKNNGLDFDYVPLKDEVVYLRENSNISTGGDSIDYTDLIYDKFKKIAVESAKAVNAKICGVDMMINDYKDLNSDYGIIELNFNPAIHIHCFPYKGTERHIGEEILKLLDFIK